MLLMYFINLYISIPFHLVFDSIIILICVLLRIHMPLLKKPICRIKIITFHCLLKIWMLQTSSISCDLIFWFAEEHRASRDILATSSYTHSLLYSDIFVINVYPICICRWKQWPIIISSGVLGCFGDVGGIITRL
jgi:hypothetical protein